MAMEPRQFLLRASRQLSSLAGVASGRPEDATNPSVAAAAVAARGSLAYKPLAEAGRITLFLCGDVMTGRGIDQVLPHPCQPRIHESYLKSALDYVQIAEEANGAIPRPVDFAYIWGDALAELTRAAPDVRIINLETSVTTSEDYWPGKGINYRMHPENIPCLTAAGIDCCCLANNHVLDWGYQGLTETVATVANAGLTHAGAGPNLAAAATPAVIELGDKGSSRNRLLLFSVGTITSGIPTSWAAQQHQPGVHLLPNLSEGTVRQMAERVQGVRQRGDIVVVSIHWGGNWGYRVPDTQRRFAHGLIDRAGVDLIHGHSSHHLKGIEVYRGKPIIYGCGDFLNDYEGISGHEEFRSDLALLFFVALDLSTGELVRFEMTPMQIRRFRLNRASYSDARWLGTILAREGQPLGTRVTLERDHYFALHWD